MSETPETPELLNYKQAERMRNLNQVIQASEVVSWFEPASGVTPNSLPIFFCKSVSALKNFS